MTMTAPDLWTGNLLRVSRSTSTGMLHSASTSTDETARYPSIVQREIFGSLNADPKVAFRVRGEQFDGTKCSRR